MQFYNKHFLNKNLKLCLEQCFRPVFFSDNVFWTHLLRFWNVFPRSPISTLQNFQSWHYFCCLKITLFLATITIGVSSARALGSCFSKSGKTKRLVVKKNSFGRKSCVLLLICTFFVYFLGGSTAAMTKTTKPTGKFT